MFCKNCGTKIPEAVSYCPNCGTQISDKVISRKPVITKSNNNSHRMKIILIGFLAMAFIAALIWRGNRSDKIHEILATTGTSMETNPIETKEDASIIGVWKCKQGEVTFTENGNMMLGKDGIVLGGGWVQYEVVDDKTLYISGGNIPLGMNIKYSLSSKYLTLELSSGNISFTKE